MVGLSSSAKGGFRRRHETGMICDMVEGLFDLMRGGCSGARHDGYSCEIGVLFA